MYDVIIVGGGASGLFSAASHPPNTKGLILEKQNKVGTKLLMSGSGQCNFTNAIDIKGFLCHYGDHGTKIRTALYAFNNLAVMRYFEEKGVTVVTREDGKVFPASLNSKDVLDVLVRESANNGFEIIYNSAVDNIKYTTAIDVDNTAIANKDDSCAIDIDDIRCVDGVYTVYTKTVNTEDTSANTNSKQFQCRKLIIATGGCSYPTTGSDGSMFKILKSMGITISPPQPALVPIFVQDYPYSSLSGISFGNVGIYIKDKGVIRKGTGPLLFTHDSFSGPAILNISRYARTGATLSIDYFPDLNISDLIDMMKQSSIGNKKLVQSFIAETFKLPARFAESIKDRLSLTGNAASLSKENMQRIAEVLKSDSFSISGIGGFKEAMATAGGVHLDEINLKTFESKKYPRMHIIGEALDIDGDTGGFNIQFAFSSGHKASF